MLCLLPNESLSDTLEAELYEWTHRDPPKANAYALRMREEKNGKWKNLSAETRLVNRTCINWTTALPPKIAKAPRLDGELLRFSD